MFGMLKTNFSKIKAERIGSGTSGAKTTELGRFKDAAEKAGVIIPPHVSLPIEVFTPTLVRAGFLTETGVYTGKSHERKGYEPRFIEFTTEEKKLIVEAFSRFMDFIVAVRSDELTAKGIGAFSTEFIRVSKETLTNGTIFAIISNILANQFNPSANAFKRRLNMPHGIGIQVMPLVGKKLSGSHRPDVIYPELSVAGFTVKDREELRFSVGYGIGGGVGMRTAQGNVDKNGEIQITGKIAQPSIAACYMSSGTFFGTTDVLRYVSLNRSEIKEMILDLWPKMLAIAHAKETDVYFEAQSTASRTAWAATQMSHHAWPKIEKPKGRELELYPVKEKDWVIGSGVVECNGIFEGTDESASGESAAEQIKAQGDKLFQHRMPPPYSFDFDIKDFVVFEKTRAIVSFREGDSFSSHVRGIFREAGILILNVAAFSTCSIPNQRMIVWADELNQDGGIIIP